MRIQPRRLLALLLLLLTACATPPSTPQTGAMPPRRNADSLEPAELSQSRLNDAYEAVRTLRPNWLRKRGAMSIMAQSDIVVYLDNVQLGGPESLRTIPLTSVLGMRFLDAADATQRWGTNHVHGAILVQTM
jgi:hypothetical protein